MTGGHDAQPCRILEAIGKQAKVRQKLSDWDLDNFQLKGPHFSWKRTGTPSILSHEKTQNSMFKAVCASPSIHTRINRPQRQSTKDSSSSEDDDDDDDNDVETPMCLEKSVEKQICLEKAQNNFPFSCAISDIKHRSSFKDFDWSSDEDCPLKYTLPTKLKTIGKTARKSISTANSKSVVIFRGSQDTSTNKINNHRSPSVKTKLKISRGELLAKSMLQSYHEGSSHKSSPHKKAVGKLVISRQNNRYTAFPVVPSCSKKLENEKFRLENFIKK